MSNCSRHIDHQHVMIPIAYPILSITRHTALEWNFRVSVDFPANWGQFVEVSLPGIGEAPISVSDFGNGWIDLLIRKVGKVTNALFNLKEGDRVWLRGCYGNGYQLEIFHNRPLLVVAGGTGVAPVKGLMRYFVDNPERVGKLDMIFGYKNRESVLYKDEMLAWKDVHNLILTIDEGEVDEFYRIGKVTEHLSELELPNIKEMQAIVVGPPTMITFTIKMLQQRGLKPEQIWVDYERRMACAIGKCGHCRMAEVYVCIDGPVFNYCDAQHFTD